MRSPRLLVLIAASLICAMNGASAGPHDSLNGKLVVGFQGWFKCPTDGGSEHKWLHWFTKNMADGAHLHLDVAPDTTELTPAEQCPTSLATRRGGVFNVYSDENPKTVLRQFEWMREYGIDVAAQQRFLVAIDPKSKPLDVRQGWDQVLDNSLHAADATGRGLYVMYDIAGADPKTWADVLVTDWQNLLASGITGRPSYQRHKGKPVLAIAGIGLGGRPGTPEEALALVSRLREVSAPYGGLTLIGAGPAGWRTGTRDVKGGREWDPVYRAFDIINPWTVGRYRDAASFEAFLKENIEPDLAETKRLGIDYMPVIYPGTSQQNLFASAGRRPADRQAQLYNMVPRDCGRFLWMQAARDRQAGATMLYAAMFDEVDEGTALFKLAQPEDDPQGVQMLSIDADGCKLPSDWYLRVSGEIAKMLKRHEPPSATLPISPP
ncbi:hypothetical protein DFR50_101264 [Roseiarcus fermentans]|uniref:Xylosidase/arabinosidase n=1 Tax=Roseiarcus fermentans TaxID=1473586 RepID=A0A366FWC2_9HYPH|nr:glycoside hydrolase family 71/99-like protein [Roseiarcus fermentans]RBP18320.1 hypothetical protein DFR50_101264 [Roseiarcus fermentans]